MVKKCSWLGVKGWVPNLNMQLGKIQSLGIKENKSFLFIDFTYNCSCKTYHQLRTNEEVTGEEHISGFLHSI